MPPWWRKLLTGESASREEAGLGEVESSRWAYGENGSGRLACQAWSLRCRCDFRSLLPEELERASFLPSHQMHGTL